MHLNQTGYGRQTIITIKFIFTPLSFTTTICKYREKKIDDRMIEEKRVDEEKLEYDMTEHYINIVEARRIDNNMFSLLHISPSVVKVS